MPMNWKSFLLSTDDSLRRALEVIDSGGERFALVVNESGKLLGVVTDGNVRRGLLRGQDLNSTVQTIMTASPLTVGPSTDRRDACELLRRSNLLHLPVVDSEGYLIDVWSLTELLKPVRYSTPVVLMVGGLGSRLGDLTKDCPKPMLQVGGRPLLEIILRNFVDQGFSAFYLAVNYRAETIQKHFGDGSALGCRINYLYEQEPLGTAGALSLLPEMDEDILVMNGDILTRLDVASLIRAHVAGKSPATMVVKQHEIEIPYGVIKCDQEGIILSIEEKPVFRYPVSAGINVLSPAAVAVIPKQTRFDMPDLFRSLLAQGEHPKIFESDDYWLDIGRLADYRQANIEFDDIFGKRQ